MVNILFLDDNKERCEKFQNLVENTTIVHTAEECITCLKNQLWNIVLLDHDLGGKIFVDSGDEDCGMAVVRFLMKAPPNPKPRIIIHSLNYPASQKMYKDLVGAGYNVERVPFTILLYSLQI
jgi:CheY-like chemotaxis protein